MSYTALSPLDDDTPHTRISEDAISILSAAAPNTGYQAYRPPPQESSHTPIPNQQPSAITYSTRLPTPPIPHRIPWPGIVPSRTPSRTRPVPSRSPTPVIRAQQSQPYDEPLPWANYSTHFRTPSSNSDVPSYQRYASSILSADTPRPSKQCFRNPRHIRAAWLTGASTRFPYKSAGALLGVLLCM
jgi:hypothetical protein